MTIELGALCNGINDSHVANSCHWFYLQTLVDEDSGLVHSQSYYVQIHQD